MRIEVGRVDLDVEGGLEEGNIEPGAVERREQAGVGELLAEPLRGGSSPATSVVVSPSGVKLTVVTRSRCSSRPVVSMSKKQVSSRKFS